MATGNATTADDRDGLGGPRHCEGCATRAAEIALLRMTLEAVRVAVATGLDQPPIQLP